MSNSQLPADDITEILDKLFGKALRLDETDEKSSPEQNSLKKIDTTSKNLVEGSTTITDSRKEEKQKKLKSLVHPNYKLEDFSYLTKSIKATAYPKTQPIQCDRCKGHFFINKPKGRCVFHPYRWRNADPTFRCCGKRKWSMGCSQNDYHVFRYKEYQYLESLIPFRETTTKKTPKTLFAAGIDCEMGYSELGYELIRLTIVDWESGNTVYDKVVHPKGKVLDLNTVFSGMVRIDEGTKDPLTGEYIGHVGFDQLWEEISEYISSSTILIGHGLENDFAVLRMIHHNVIDTCILYSLSSTRRLALKFLASKYLNREIQTGTHDSAEDAKAAIDLVNLKL